MVLTVLCTSLVPTRMFVLLGRKPLLICQYRFCLYPSTSAAKGESSVALHVQNVVVKDSRQGELLNGKENVCCFCCCARATNIELDTANANYFQTHHSLASNPLSEEPSASAVVERRPR